MDNYRDSIFEPLEYYTGTAKELHKTNTSQYFENLLEISKVNVEENKKTVSEYKKELAAIDKLNKKVRAQKALRITVLIICILLLSVAIALPFILDLKAAFKILIPLLFAALLSVTVILVFKTTGKKLAHLRQTIDVHKRTADNLLQIAMEQMAPLNNLFTDTDAYNIIESTMPQIKFDRQFILENLQDLKNNYNFNDTVGPRGSVLDVLSGTLYENPFLFERYLSEEIVAHTYTGTLVISWTTYSTDSKGNRVSKRHTQTLVAKLTKPKPVYTVKTLLNYGCQAGPDLSFTRENHHFEDMSENQIERQVKKGKKKLKKKAANALKNGQNFTEMSNATFDVLFDATNRDNEQQFRFLFTPLAQKEMLDLIRSEEGYGDDFDFFKQKKHNIIRSEHSQTMVLYPAASNYYSYDVEDARNKFINFNCEYFKAIYFDMAPLISIPAYQSAPATSFEEIEHPEFGYTEYNYETIANRIGVRNFAHANTTTEAILKTELIKRTKEYDTVAVTAYSFNGIPRTDFIPVLGGDGRMHSVPVHWIDYIPLQKTSLMNVKNIGIEETDYRQRQNASSVRPPANAACFRGMFGHTDSDNRYANDFLNSILK